jgi:thiol-disulfide isomerase/thioredoxin
MTRVIACCLFVLPLFSWNSSAQHLANRAIDSTEAVTILYVFTGSDWCAGCIRLEKQILSDTSFLEGMRAHEVNVEKIDFPQRKKQAVHVVTYNRTMAEKLSFDGTFPSLVLYSPITTKHTTILYQGESAEDFVKKIISEATRLHDRISD